MEQKDNSTPEVTREVQAPDPLESSEVVEQKPKKKWVAVYLAALAMVFLGMIGFLVYQDYQLKKQLLPPTPSPTAVSPTTPPDLTANWETYTNSKYGYTVKYPKGWYLYEPETVTAYSRNTVGFWPEKSEGENLGFWVTVRDDRFTYTDLNSWWEGHKKMMATPLDEYAIEEKKYLAENFGKLIEVESLVISGQPALKVETKTGYPSIPFRSVFVVSKDNEIIDINTNITNPNSPYFDFFNQILSTFKFLDQKKVDETAGWETFANEEYKLVFKYPREFTIKEEPVPSAKYTQVIFNETQQNSFVIQARKDYLPADATYFLDTEPIGEKSIAGNLWKIYFLSEGYCDGPECTLPIYALQIEKGGILYRATFYNQSKLTSTQELILSTLELTN